MKLILAGDSNYQPITPSLIKHADELINFFQIY